MGDLQKMRKISLCAMLLTAAVVCTAQNTFTEYPLPTSGSLPHSITGGADGNLWFTEVMGNKIGRITPTGDITEFLIPTDGSMTGILLGSETARVLSHTKIPVLVLR